MGEYAFNTLLDDYGSLNNEAFRTLLRNTKDYIFVKNMELVYVAASMPFAHMVNLNSPDEIIGRTDIDVFGDEELAARYVMDDLNVLNTGNNQIDFLEPIANENGRARYSSTSKYILKDERGNTIGLLGMGRDVTREYLAQLHHQQELQYLFELPEDTYAATFIDVDDWRVITQRRREIKGATLQVCGNVEQVVGMMLDSIAEDGGEAADFYRDFSRETLWSIYESGKRLLTFNCCRNMPDGTARWVESHIQFLLDPKTDHLCVMLSTKDIDKEIKDEIELIHAAEQDPLTGLFNRAYATKCIMSTLGQEGGQRHAFMIMDVDNFKSLNDTHGHMEGDRFLIALAAAIRGCFRESDIVGRMGGDEFFVLMKDIQQDADVQEKARTLLDAISAICSQYPTLELSASIGVSIYPNDGSTLDQLYAAADVALYDAKGAGKGRAVFSRGVR